MNHPTLWVFQGMEERLLRLPERPWEVGGWLLGYRAEEGRSIVVTHGTPPARRGTPFGVHISGDGHRGRFDQAWERSGGYVTFLGDWHTHPGGVAQPSVRDRRAICKLATNSDFQTPQPLIAIASLRRWPWRHSREEVRWFLGDEGGSRVVELEPRYVQGLTDEAVAVPSWPWPHRRA
jgi:integrative and conjugative element protein (TIGR02256 family)